LAVSWFKRAISPCFEGVCGNFTNFKSMRSTLLWFLLFSIPCFAQQEGRLDDFSAVRLDGRNVEIRWTLKAGVSCQSPEVQRGRDTVTFTSIYRYPGVCGGGETAETYSWIDPQASSERNLYYRLRIDDGEFSKVALLEGSILPAQTPLFIYPSPARDLLNLLHQEALGEPLVMRIFNTKGAEFKAIQKERLEKGAYRLRIDHLPSSIYFLMIEFRSGQRRSVKFIKQE